MMYPRGMLKNTEEISRQIAAHPDWPIVISAGRAASSGAYEWQHCTRIAGRPGMIS